MDLNFLQSAIYKEFGITGLIFAVMVLYVGYLFLKFASALVKNEEKVANLLNDISVAATQNKLSIEHSLEKSEEFHQSLLDQVTRNVEIQREIVSSLKDITAALVESRVQREKDKNELARFLGDRRSGGVVE